jgi:hypothetical protein
MEDLKWSNSGGGGVKSIIVFFFFFFFHVCVCVYIYIYNQIDMIHGHMVILIPKLQGP